VYAALFLSPAGKLAQQALTAAHVCAVTTSRLFVADMVSKRQFLVDTDSDLCVFPRKFTSGRKERVNYDLFGGQRDHHTHLRMAVPQPQPWSSPRLHVAVRGCRHPAPVIGVDLLSHFGLIVDCCNNRLLDAVTSLSTPAQAANSLMPSIKTISNDTAVNGLLAEFPDLTRPTGAQSEIRHNTVHHIRTTPGPPATC
jgi:hypothetical protein